MMAKGVTSSASAAGPAVVAADPEQVVACSSQASCEEFEEGAAMPSFSFNGSTFNHLTINVQGVYRGNKQEGNCLSLKLKKAAK